MNEVTQKISDEKTYTYIFVYMYITALSNIL